MDLSVGWVDLGWMQVPTKLLPPRQGTRGKGGYDGKRPFLGQDKGSLITQNQRLCMEAKENKKNYSPIPINPATPWGTDLGDKSRDNEFPISSFCLRFYC